jgi:hypothetical protein
MTISLLPKLAGEVRRYGHDWSAFLGDDTIASQSNTITGATLDSATIDTGNQSVVFTISGGTAGTAARLTHTITTAAGDHETEIFRIPIGAEEPVTLREAKAQTNMANDDSQDEFLEGLISPARAYVERVSRYSFVAGSKTVTFSRWGDFLEIYRHGIASVDGVTYSTTADPLDDADYTGFVANLGFPVRISPAVDDTFPTLITGGTVTVAFTTGSLDEGPTTLATRNARVRLGSSQEQRQAAQEAASQSATFECIRSAALDAIPVTARIQYDGSQWDINGRSPMSRKDIWFTAIRLL